MVRQMHTQEMCDFKLTEKNLFEQSGDGDDGVLRMKRKRGAKLKRETGPGVCEKMKQQRGGGLYSQPFEVIGREIPCRSSLQSERIQTRHK